MPVALWGPKAPTHRISYVHMMHNERNLITGSQDGQICIWDVELDPILSVTPRCMIFGHTSAVLCIADGDFVTKNTIVTSSDNGEMCLWNVDDGQCLETKKTQYTHTFMQSFKISAKDCKLFCVGHYAEILVIDAKTFNIQFRLSSKDKPDWITSIHILQPPQLTNIVIIGLSISGIVRIWTITDDANKKLDPIYDNDMRILDCVRSVQIISNPESLRLILIVCPLQWEIYDATDFQKLCTVEVSDNTHWTGGNFITRDQVLVWNNKGESYLYQVTTKRGSDNKQPSTRLKTKLSCQSDSRFLYSPKMCLSSNASGKLLIRGDPNGAITFWSLATINHNQEQVMNIQPKFQQSLENSWKQGLLEERPNNLFLNYRVTSSVYLPAISKLACACEDGSIIISTITQLALLKLQSDIDNSCLDQENINLEKSPGSKVYKAHAGRINCLLYPNSTNPRYDERHLVSGGVDFAVCLWDVPAENLLYKFNVHAGEITQFLVPPNECSERLKNSICCVASDHSVSILNLSERRCTLLASRHLFPVSVIKWRPTDDSMVVGCIDGSAYIWRVETGYLIKVLQGVIAEDTLAACDESIVAKEDHTNPAIELFKGLKQGNLSAIKNAAAKGLNQLAAQHAQAKVDLAASYRSHPLTIQNLKANTRDKDAYVIFFDIESIIAYLLHEPNLVLETASIFLSILQAWGLDEEAKKICVNHPELLKNFKPACIGLISKSCYISLLLPSYVKKLDPEVRRSKFFSANYSLSRLTGQCLSHLLFVPSSPSLPLYAALRYTAVGLIGRGFTFWEPFLDVAKVLLGLLDLSSELYPQKSTINNGANKVTTPAIVTNSLQAARDALSAIAVVRPSVFITTLAREVAKYNSKQPNAHSRTTNYGQQVPPILVRSKLEILRNISIIIDTTPLEVANLMVETMDITLHCIDHSLLENRGLGEAFPAITRFYMVSYCSSSRRIAVGTVAGNLAMYELRAQSKPQIVAAHKSAISACSFSPDGKYLASYSAGENKLCFWLTATGLFGLGNARTRCVGSIDTPPVSADLIKSPTDLLRVARLIWVAGKVVILMFIDEREFRYQVAS